MRAAHNAHVFASLLQIQHCHLIWAIQFLSQINIKCTPKQWGGSCSCHGWSAPAVGQIPLVTWVEQPGPLSLHTICSLKHESQHWKKVKPSQWETKTYFPSEIMALIQITAVKSYKYITPLALLMPRENPTITVQNHLRRFYSRGVVLFLKCPNVLTSLNQSSCCHTNHMEQ